MEQSHLLLILASGLAACAHATAGGSTATANTGAQTTSDDTDTSAKADMPAPLSNECTILLPQTVFQRQLQSITIEGEAPCVIGAGEIIRGTMSAKFQFQSRPNALDRLSIGFCIADKRDVSQDCTTSIVNGAAWVDTLDSIDGAYQVLLRADFVRPKGDEIVGYVRLGVVSSTTTMLNGKITFEAKAAQTPMGGTSTVAPQ